MTTTTEQAATKVVTYRLPRPGTGDPYFGLSRSYYYVLNKLFLDECGEPLLIHVTTEGRTRGITLVPYDPVEAFLRCLASGQSPHSAIIEAMKAKQTKHRKGN